MNNTNAAKLTALTFIEKIRQQSPRGLNRLAVQIKFGHDAKFATPQSAQGLLLQSRPSVGQRLAQLRAQRVVGRGALREFAQYRAVIGMALSGDWRRAAPSELSALA
jgi:hypothetical protein